MPTKFLVVETPEFQLDENMGASAERIGFDAFAERLKRHFDDTIQQEIANEAPNLLFILAHNAMKTQSAFQEAVAATVPTSTAFFSSTHDALRFLPMILAFDGSERSGGAKEFLKKGSTIYSDTLFNGKGVGTRLDPCFVLARENLPVTSAFKAWACLQTLALVGLQSLPEIGEKATGEKVDIQIGADEKAVALNVTFTLPQDQLPTLRSSPLLLLPKELGDVFEVRYISSGHRAELNCLFFRSSGFERCIEITSFQASAALEKGAKVKELNFRALSGIPTASPNPKKPSHGGFKKKFSEQMGTSKTDLPEPSKAPAKEPSIMVSGNASLTQETGSVLMSEVATNHVNELEFKVKSLEAALKTREEMIAKFKGTKELKDQPDKHDLLSNIQDSKSDGLKQNIKKLEDNLTEANEREKQLMTMVDKAVQIKEEATRKVKELEVKLKAATGENNSKVQALEKALEEQRRQNKELSKKISELSEQDKAA